MFIAISHPESRNHQSIGVPCCDVCCGAVLLGRDLLSSTSLQSACRLIVNMFWGTVVEPGARVIISAPPNVSQLRITKALPYDVDSYQPRNRLFLDTQNAAPVLICNNTGKIVDGCSLDISLSRSDLDRGPVLYQTREECRWALTGVAEATASLDEQPNVNKGHDGSDWAKEAALLGFVTVLLTVLNTALIVDKY